MEINYKTKKLKKSLTDDRKLSKEFGQRAKKIKLRLKEIKSADNLKILGELPQLRLHPYKGKREGRMVDRYKRQLADRFYIRSRSRSNTCRWRC